MCHLLKSRARCFEQATWLRVRAVGAKTDPSNWHYGERCWFHRTAPKNASTNQGHVKLTPNEYIDFVRAARPAVFDALSDPLPANQLSKNRVRKSVDRTVAWLDAQIKLVADSQTATAPTSAALHDGGDQGEDDDESLDKFIF